MAAAPHIAGVEPLEQQPSDFFTALAGGYIRVMGIAARHQWALQLTHLPTTSGREQRVQAWVRAWAKRRPELVVREDRAGNLLLTIKGRRRLNPVIAVAHMDHPGFVVDRVDGRDVGASFMGGVLAQYFPDAPVELFDSSDERVAGRVVAHDAEDGAVEIRLVRGLPSLARGDVGRWRFPPRSLGIRGGRLRAPACDDLAGVAAALTALDQARRKPELAHFAVLLTRAEEEGFIGAIAACKLGTIPDGARLLSIETSRSFPDAPIDGGPIVRVGDLSSVFDHALTNGVTSVVRRRKLVHQRKLMAGGSCEATAFGAYGYSATGLCLALGNYHNMIDIDGVRAGSAPARLGPEEISLADFDGLVSLMLAVASDIDAAASAIVDRLEDRYESRSGLLN